MMRRPNRSTKENKNQLDNPEVSHVNAYHGSESIGYTLGLHYFDISRWRRTAYRAALSLRVDCLLNLLMVSS
jgi:hypothetical protein